MKYWEMVVVIRKWSLLQYNGRCTTYIKKMVEDVQGIYNNNSNNNGNDKNNDNDNNNNSNNNSQYL